MRSPTRPGEAGAPLWRCPARPGVLVASVAASTRMVVILAGTQQHTLFVGGDTDEYLALADSPSGYWDNGSTSSALSFSRPPGYPMLLAPIRALSPSLVLAGLFQVAIGSLVAWLTYRAALLVLGEGAALLAGLWVAVDPATVVQSGRLLTEVPFAAAFLVWVICSAHAMRGRSIAWAGAAGGAIAIATFIRPISLYLPLLAAPALFVAVRRRSNPGRGARPIVLVGAFALAFSLPVGAWFVRNQAVGGVTTFSTIEGTNLLDYRAAASIAEEQGLSLSQGRARARAALEARIEPGTTGAAFDHQKAGVGKELILEHPVGYAAQAAKGLARTLFGTQRTETAELTDALPGGSTLTPAMTLAALGSATLAVLGSGAGAVVAVRRRDPIVLVSMVLPLAYVLLIGSGVESDARFRVPLVPAMAILSLYALSPRATDADRQSVDVDEDDDWLIDLREPVLVGTAPMAGPGDPPERPSPREREPVNDARASARARGPTAKGGGSIHAPPRSPSSPSTSDAP